MKGKRAKLCKERKKGLKSIEIEEVFIPTPFVVNFPQIKCTSLQSLKNASRHFIFTFKLYKTAQSLGRPLFFLSWQSNGMNDSTIPLLKSVYMGLWLQLFGI